MGSAYQARGFTLAELLLILVIAGLLSAMAIPRYHAWLMDNRRQQAINDIQKIATTIERQRPANLSHAAISRCDQLLSNNNPAYTYDCQNLPDGGYLIQALAKPPMQGDYSYYSNGQLFTQWSQRRDDCWRLSPDSTCMTHFPAIITGTAS